MKGRDYLSPEGWRGLFALGLGLLALLLPGCAPRLIEATAEQKAHSFEAYEKARIAGMPARKFMGTSTALLIRSEGMEVKRLNDHSGTMSFAADADSLEIATATVIDRRGYFLTAAHAVRNGPPVLLFTAGGKGEFAQSRIVWKGSAEIGDLDLALLHVPYRLDRSLKWAPELEPGEPVLTSGYYHLEDGGYAAQHLSGQVLGWEEVAKEKSRAKVGFTNVYFDVPVSRGNSGGPALTPRGELIGISVALHAQFKLRKLALEQWGGAAVRPDPEWVAELIREDQAGLRKVTAGQN
jgi:S1-C subfamily serine protease